MKPNKQKLLVLSLLLLFFISSFSQETITIQLIVDTENFNVDDVYSSCSFEATYSSDGRIVTSKGNLEDFLIDAKISDTIIWEGVSKTSTDDTVDIKKIYRQRGTKIFKYRKNLGKTHGNSNKETVKINILYNTLDKPDYKYSITFKINKRGKRHHIDPKIKVGS